jgi:hypothetical protein
MGVWVWVWVWVDIGGRNCLRSFRGDSFRIGICTINGGLVKIPRFYESYYIGCIVI